MCLAGYFLGQIKLDLDASPIADVFQPKRELFLLLQMIQSVRSMAIDAKRPWHTLDIEGHLEKFVPVYVDKAEFYVGVLGSKLIVDLFGSD